MQMIGHLNDLSLQNRRFGVMNMIAIILRLWENVILKQITIIRTMQYQVLLQNPSAHRYVASVIGLTGVMAEAETEEEVITKIKTVLTSQLETAKFITIEVGESTSSQQKKPEMKYAGILAHDPTFEDWMQKMENIRQQTNKMNDDE
jgi:predicted RNase H-like HicB family nuclease